MKQANTVRIGYTQLIIPDEIKGKDLQQLLGFLATLQICETRHNFDQGAEPLSYADGYPQVKLETVTLTSKEEANRVHDESHARYLARQTTEKSS